MQLCEAFRHFSIFFKEKAFVFMYFPLTDGPGTEY